MDSLAPNTHRLETGSPPRAMIVSLDRSPSTDSAGAGRGPLFTPALIWHVACGRWKLASALGVMLGVVAAVVVWYTFQPQYRAEAWLRIEDRRPYLAFPAKEDSRLFVQTQLEMLRSPPVLAEVLAMPEIGNLPEVREQEDREAWLQEQLQVESVGRSELFRVVFTGPSAERAAMIANAVVGAYLSNTLTEEAAQTSRVLELLREENTLRKKNLDQERDNLRALMRQASGGDSVRSQDGEGGPGALSALEARLIDVEVERELLEVQLKARQQSPEVRGMVPENLIELTLARDPELLDLEATIRLKEQDLARAAPASAYRRELQRQIEEARAQLDGRRQALRPKAEEQLRVPAEAQAARELAELEHRLASQRVLADFLAQRIEQERSTSRQTEGHSLDLEFARAELARTEAVIQKIADRALVLSTESRAPQRVTLLRRAEKPIAPIESWPYKRLIPAAFAGLILPLGLLVVWEALARRIVGSDQLVQETHLPVIGEVATLPARPLLPRRGALRRYQRDLALFRESVHSVGTALAVSDAVRERKVLVIASAVSGEGKSNLAAQLAVGWARAGSEPVLVVDCDLRSPTLHEIFGVRATPGVIEVLRGQCPLDEAIQTDWGDRVHILPGGRLEATSPHRLACSQDFERLLQSLRERYARIVIDVAPLLAASESLQVAKLADGVVFCALQDRSRADQIRLACQKLAAAGIQPIGTVLNGMPSRHYVSRYGAYYESNGET
jgi:capsular exopolysaccharide synthesis family protein